MKKEQLFEIIGETNENEAARIFATKKKKRFITRSVGAVAASFALIAAVGIPMVHFASKDPSEQIEGIPSTDKENRIGIYEDLAYPYRAENEKIENKLVINRSQGSASADMDVKIGANGKIPEKVWNEILEGFYADTGVEYTRYQGLLGENWSYALFHTLSVRGYKEGLVDDEYKLHDYVFRYDAIDGEGCVTVALCAFEEPLRDCIVISDTAEPSVIDGTEIVIHAVGDSYMAKFFAGGIYYDVKVQNVDENELERILSCIVSVTDGAADTDITEMAADADAGIYREAVESDDLSLVARKVFGGSYLENGNYIVLLTEDTPETRAAVCAEIGISEADTVFQKAAYTLEYLAELQGKISDSMTAKELPFVVSSSLREKENCIFVTVTANDEETEKKLAAFDTLGGAVEIHLGETTFVDVLTVKE